MGKYCCFDNCNSDSRYHKDMIFYPIPKPGKNGKKLAVCQKWIESINRKNITVESVKKHHYVCSLHFKDSTGPTMENPFPSRLPDKVPEPTCFTIPVNKSGMRSYSKHQPEINSPQQLTTQINNSSEINPMTLSVPMAVSWSTISKIKCEDNSDQLIKEVIKELGCQPKLKDNSTIRLTSDAEPLIKKELIEDEYIINQPISEKFSFDILLKEVILHQEENKTTFLWTILLEPNHLVLCKRKGGVLLIRFEVSETLDVELFIMEKKIERTHDIFSNGCQISSLKELLNMILNFEFNWSVCWGVSGTLFDNFLNHSNKTATYCPETNTLRSLKCQYIRKISTDWCINCRLLRNNLARRAKRKNNEVLFSKKTDLQNLDLEQIRMRMLKINQKNKNISRKNKALKQKLENLIAINCFQLTSEESDELCKIAQENFETPTNFQEFLLNQQLQIANSPTTRPRKWHPAMIQWCLDIRSKSPSTYEALRQALILPTARTLVNYSKDMRTDLNLESPISSFRNTTNIFEQ